MPSRSGSADGSGSSSEAQVGRRVLLKAVFADLEVEVRTSRDAGVAAEGNEIASQDVVADLDLQLREVRVERVQAAAVVGDPFEIEVAARVAELPVLDDRPADDQRAIDEYATTRQGTSRSARSRTCVVLLRAPVRVDRRVSLRSISGSSPFFEISRTRGSAAWRTARPCKYHARRKW